MPWKVKKLTKKLKRRRKKESQKRKAENARKDANKPKKMAIQKKKQQKHVRQIKFDNDSVSSDSSISKDYMESDDDIDYVGDTEEVCLICSESGKDELWYACSSCSKWVHAACTGLTASEAKRKAYIQFLSSYPPNIVILPAYEGKMTNLTSNF
ncbi:unnamed protein product [Acanthoscelides obtectus]|uniref:PHD-type domain-containing protein n=1 Tax=Acanthoscelides obtectus TaxID=200917 RepID=A0A9P0KQM1_ACAOB|nr:unnamed protein product [Acanthoscelides obtectus]CAK1634384.1 hypothetical protein AOBTE_LOCUS8739 [Acanthoscelides obtectus]